MNFGFTDEQEALRALAVQVLDDHGPMGSPPEPFDRSLWKAMVVSGLVGAPLAAPAGADLGLIGLGIVAEELGRRAALQPFGATVGAVLVLERLGAPAAAGLAQRVADGEAVATFALEEAVGFDPRQPTTQARRDGTAWRLSGQKVGVPYAESADVLLVGAMSDGGPVLAVVDRTAPGVGLRSAVGTDDEPCGSVDLDQVEVADDDVFGGPALGITTDMATAAWCAAAAGLIEGGLRITSDYIAAREQFGRPIATFQGP
ncbi:MAG TPA: acyl-CoA dehydrogenase family protein, partial [Acidimicrobiales bacterium]|nr:acyl-CoA dehydrogenase family protein [Acidimicrobiales bacterium]